MHLQKQGQILEYVIFLLLQGCYETVAPCSLGVTAPKCSSRDALSSSLMPALISEEQGCRGEVFNT